VWLEEERLGTSPIPGNLQGKSMLSCVVLEQVAATIRSIEFNNGVYWHFFRIFQS